MPLKSIVHFISSITFFIKTILSFLILFFSSFLKISLTQWFLWYLQSLGMWGTRPSSLMSFFFFKLFALFLYSLSFSLPISYIETLLVKKNNNGVGIVLMIPSPEPCQKLLLCFPGWKERGGREKDWSLFVQPNPSTNPLIAYCPFFKGQQPASPPL